MCAMSAKIFSVAKSFYEQRTKYDNLSKSEKDPIDSFLSFVSFVTKDKSYYPFWAKIGFENCSSFISEYVCFDYENHPCNEDTLEWRACEFILNRRSYVWEFLKQFPTFIYSKDLYNRNTLVPNQIFRSVLEKLVFDTSEIYEKTRRILRLAACNAFLQYSDKLFDDIAKISSGERVFCSTGVLEFVEQFNHDRKNIFLNKLRSSLSRFGLN